MEENKKDTKRGDLVKKMLDAKALPSNASTVEGKLIIAMAEAVLSQDSGYASAFNALMDMRYGKQATGDGPELSHGKDEAIEVSFGT